MSGQRRGVLVLTASYGSGHNRVAGALAGEFRRAGVDVSVVDHFRELVHPCFDRASRALYYAVLDWAPALWGMAYWLGDQLSVTSPLLFGITRLGARRLAELMETTRPTHVVTVHPAPAAALSEVRRWGVPTPPHTTVFTDFAAHTQWVVPDVDRYCVPADEIANALMARGLGREQVSVTGIPVRPNLGGSGERAAARLGLGLSSRLPVFLLMAGTHGRLGRLEEGLRVVLELEEPVQTLVVAGREESLVTRLRNLVRGHEARVKVFGYVEDMHRLFTAADLMITKAGGVSLAEAVAAGLPVICFGSLPGQEARNERWASMAGVALVAQSGAQLHRALVAVLRDPGLLRAMRARIRAYGRPEAARHVVDLVLGPSLAARGRAS